MRSSGRPGSPSCSASWISSSTRRSRTPSSRSPTARASRRTSTRSTPRCRTTSRSAGCRPPARARSCASPSLLTAPSPSSPATLRKLEKAGEEPIIPSDEARKACEQLYDEGVRQGEPTLGYLLPALGAVETIYPSYTCNPSGERGQQAHLQVPAIEGIGPKAKIEVSRSGEKILGEADAGDGSVYKWSSSSTALTDNEGEQIAYERRAARQDDRSETVTLEVTDRNGLSATASVTLDGDGDGDRRDRRPAAAASASWPWARPTSASSRPSTSGSARRTAPSASRT